MRALKQRVVASSGMDYSGGRGVVMSCHAHLTERTELWDGECSSSEVTDAAYGCRKARRILPSIRSGLAA